MSWSNKSKRCPDCGKVTIHHKEIKEELSEGVSAPYTESCTSCGHHEIGLEIYGLTQEEKDKENEGFFTG